LKSCGDAADSKNLTDLDVRQLEGFNKMHHLKKASIGIIVTQLDNKKIQNLKALFHSMDTNKDGTLSPEEMREGFCNSGLELPDDIEELIKSIDTDGSGSVDYTEFLTATATKQTYHQRDVVWTAFKKFDKDGSGAIEADELAAVLNDAAVLQALHLDANQLDALMKDIDLNGDGIIDFEEFYHMIGKGSGPPKRSPRSSPRSKARQSSGQKNTLVGEETFDFSLNELQDQLRLLQTQKPDGHKTIVALQAQITLQEEAQIQVSGKKSRDDEKRKKRIASKAEGEHRIDATHNLDDIGDISHLMSSK